MRFHQRRETRLEVDITPLIDVVFLLLIFFMVASTFDRQAVLRVQLPEASADAREEEPKSIVVTIDRQGRHYIGEQAVVNSELTTLRAAFAQAAAGRTDAVVILNADGKAPHEAVVRAMDAAGQAGLTQIRFATRRME